MIHTWWDLLNEPFLNSLHFIEFMRRKASNICIWLPWSKKYTAMRFIRSWTHSLQESRNPLRRFQFQICLVHFKGFGYFVIVCGLSNLQYMHLQIKAYIPLVVYQQFSGCTAHSNPCPETKLAQSEYFFNLQIYLSSEKLHFQSWAISFRDYKLPFQNPKHPLNK